MEHKRINVTLTPEERTRIERAARRENMSARSWGAATIMSVMQAGRENALALVDRVRPNGVPGATVSGRTSTLDMLLPVFMCVDNLDSAARIKALARNDLVRMILTDAALKSEAGTHQVIRVVSGKLPKKLTNRVRQLPHPRNTDRSIVTAIRWTLLEWVLLGRAAEMELAAAIEWIAAEDGAQSEPFSYQPQGELTIIQGTFHEWGLSHSQILDAACASAIQRILNLDLKRQRSDQST